MSNINKKIKSPEIKNNDNEYVYLWFIHIPKNAGSTITGIFYKKGVIIGRQFYNKNLKYLCPSPDQYNLFVDPKFSHKDISTFIDVPNNGKRYFSDAINFWHLPMRFWKSNYIKYYKNGYVIFCVVRNPYDKIVSEFNFWINFLTEHKREKRTTDNVMNFYDGDLSITPENLNKFIVKACNKNNCFSLDGHILPQYVYVYENDDFNSKSKIPHVILKFENLKNDFNSFVNKYKLGIDPNVISSTKLNQSSVKNVTVNDITPENIELVYNYYINDFKLFGYNKNPSFTK